MCEILAPYFGDGITGAVTITSSDINSVRSAVTGSVNSTSLVVSTPGSWANDDLVFIHQTQGAGNGQCEFNRISSINGSVSPFVMKNSLKYNYVAGAQMMKVPRYQSASLANGQTIAPPAWNGSSGGVSILVCDGTFQFDGAINADGVGFRGQAGEGNGAYVGRRGEGTGGNDAARSTSAQGNGGGAGGYSNNGPWDQGNGAGGGNNQGGAQNGNGTGGGNNSNGSSGSLGGVVGLNDILLNMNLGGAGGEGGNNNSSGGTGGGGNGGGIVIIIARNTNVGATANILCRGNNGGGAGFHSGCGGSGAGGCIAIISEIITLTAGHNIYAYGGSHITNSNGGPDSDGGAGGYGWISFYAGKIVGTPNTSPAYQTNPDTAFQKFCGKVGIVS